MHVRRLETLLPGLLFLVVLGCGGSGNAPDGGGGGGDKTVSGQVLDQNGQPLQNRTVLIGPGTATTNASGQFTITGVATPYDLIILEPAPTKFATVYSQLTRTDPKLLDFAVTGQLAFSATLGGTIDGGDPLPTPAGTFTAISFGSLQAAQTAYVNASPYSFDVPWAGPNTVAGTVHGLQFTTDQNFTVTGYHAHGVKTGVSLTSGGVVTDANLDLTPVLSENISVSIVPPPGHEIFERDMYLSFDDGAFVQVSADGLDAGILQVPMPSNIGATAMVFVVALTSDGASETDAQIAGLAPGTLDAGLNLPSPARVTAPADGATGVNTATDLVWTPVSGAIHLLFLSGAASDPVYAIVSGGTRARIPDLSQQGLGLPSGHAYDFVLLAIGPFSSIDAFAETTVIPPDKLGFRTVTHSTFTTR